VIGATQHDKAAVPTSGLAARRLWLRNQSPVRPTRMCPDHSPDRHRESALGAPPAPEEETATFKRVRQARRHELWRVAHPFDPSVAVRIICWFPSDTEVVIALVGFDKKAIRDVFYASAAARGEAMVDAWLRQEGSSNDRRS
jgi:hypothetical protein